MIEILKTLKDTPLPSILVIGGILFLLLSFVRKVGSNIELEPAKAWLVAIVGIVLLCSGVALYIVPAMQTSLALSPTETPKVDSPTAITQPSAAPTVQVQSTNIPATATCSGIEPLQDRILTGREKKEFTISLGDGEVVVGQGWQFWYGDAPIDKCYAFIIEKPGTYTFSLYDGAWSKYKVCSSSQAESLLQGESNILATFCTPVLTRRVP